MANYAQILQTLEQACLDFQVTILLRDLFVVNLNPKNLNIA